MGALGVVVDFPIFDELPRVAQVNEVVLVEAFVAHLPVEAFHNRVFRGLSRLDVVKVYLGLLAPGK